MTPSIRNALADLGLVRVAVVYPGTQRFPLEERVEVVPLAALSRGDPLFDSAGPQAELPFRTPPM